MTAQGAGDSAHRFQAATQGAGNPAVKERLRPAWMIVGPEMGERFLQYPGTRGSEFRSDYTIEPLPGFSTDARTRSEQQPAGLLQAFTARTGPQEMSLGTADLVNRLIQQRGEVKPVKDLYGMTHMLSDHRQIRSPHVTDHHFNAGDDTGSQGLQSLAKCSLGTPEPHPQQAAAPRINLRDQRHEVLRLFALAPMKLINANGTHALQNASGQPPCHDPCDRAIHRFPAHLVDLSHLSPAHPPCPSCQEDHHRQRPWTFPVAPRQRLNPHAMFFTIHPSRTKEHPRHDPPQWHMFPRPPRQMVIRRRRLPANRAPTEPLSVRFNLDPQLERVLKLFQRNRRVCEAGNGLCFVHQRLNLHLHGWPPGWFVSHRCLYAPATQRASRPYTDMASVAFPLGTSKSSAVTLGALGRELHSSRPTRGARAPYGHPESRKALPVYPQIMLRTPIFHTRKGTSKACGSRWRA